MLIVNDNTHQDTTNPTLDHFQPFDLDAWYFYSFITFTHKNLYRPNSSLCLILLMFRWGRKLYQDLTSGL